MPPEQIFQALARTPTTFGVPRDFSRAVVIVGMIATLVALLAHAWFAIPVVPVGLGAFLWVMRSLSARNPRWVYQFSESLTAPRHLSARSNLRAPNATHR